MNTGGTRTNPAMEKSSHQKLNQQQIQNSSHRKLKQKLGESKIGDHGISKEKEHNEVYGGVRGTLPGMAPESFRGKSHLITNENGDRGLSKVKEHIVVSGGAPGALPSMAPESFRGKSHLITNEIRHRGLSKVKEHTVVSGYVRGLSKSSDIAMKKKRLHKMDYSRSGPGTGVPKRHGLQNSSTNHHSQPIHKGHSSLRLRDEDYPVRETTKTSSHNPNFIRGISKKRTRNEDLEDYLEVNSPRTDIHTNDPQSEEHIGSTSNGTTATRKETRALSATKRNRLNNRKLVFEVDDCAGRIVGEDSQTFITKGGCLVRESAKFDGTTWRKQQPLLKTDIISKTTENSSFNLNCQSMARAINSQLANQHKSKRWRLHSHYKNYATKEQAIMNPPRGVKIHDWVLLCDRFASEDFQKISARIKMNRSKNLVPPAFGSKSMARVVYEKMKQGKQVTAIGQYEICHYSRKKEGMINETADKILRDLRDEEANSSSTPAEICIAKLEGTRIRKGKNKETPDAHNKVEKKHNNLKQKVDYLMKHLPHLSGWKSQGKGNGEYADDDDDDDDDDGQGNEEYDGFNDDDNGDDAQGSEEYDRSDGDDYGADGLDDYGEDHEDAI